MAESNIDARPSLIALHLHGGGGLLIAERDEIEFVGGEPIPGLSEKYRYYNRVTDMRYIDHSGARPLYGRYDANLICRASLEAF